MISEQPFGHAKLPITGHASLITLRGTAIQISLQNHLRRDLVNVPAGVPSFLAGVAQCTVGCDRRESLVPCDDRAGENRPQLFHELEHLGRSSSDLPIHLTRDARYHVVDLLFANNFRDTQCRFFICWNGLERMRQHLQFIRDRHSDARAPKIQTQNPIHRAPRHCNSGGSLPIKSLIRSASCRWQTKRASGVRTTIKSCTPRSAIVVPFSSKTMLLLESIAVIAQFAAFPRLSFSK